MLCDTLLKAVESSIRLTNKVQLFRHIQKYYCAILPGIITILIADFNCGGGMRLKLQKGQNKSNGEQQLRAQMINDNQKGEMIRHFMSQVKIEDLLNVGFMKPIQVALRTSRNDKSVPQDSLPEGLMIAVKNSIADNKHELAPIKSIGPEFNALKELKPRNLDNFISLLKKPDLPEILEPRIQIDEKAQIPHETNDQMQLGICVSMHKQDKKILKRTLIGVADNIDEMIRSGVSPDDIFVVVMIDGVQSVDSSLYQYFEEFERESQIYLEDDELLTLKKKYENYQYHQEIEKQEPLNFSKFLFKPDEFAERIQGKFQNVRKRYDEVLRIKKSIQNIKKENAKDNDNLKMILNRMIDKQKTIMKKINTGQQDKKVLINEESIMKELANSQEECNQYISTRENLAYTMAYRIPTSSLSESCREKETANTLRQSTLIEGQFQTERMYDEELMDRTSSRSSNPEFKTETKRSIRYVNLFFCIKYKETGKLSSHNWFFNGFCKELKPKYSVLLDVGVRPYPDAIFKMYRHMKLNQNVGSVCGYLRLIEEKVEDEQMTKSEDMDCLSSILVNIFDIQRAQQIQYHFQNIVDKPFESLFKFIHVLPGSFSGYNMSALRPINSKDELLKQYFRSMDDKLATNKVVQSTFTCNDIMLRVFLPKSLWKCCSKIDPDSQEQMLYNENIYQAEDRILCLGIHKNDKDIIFMPDVYAQVEPIKMINDLMTLRKKDVNGGLYSFEKVSEELGNTQSKSTNFFLRFQLLYLSFTKFLGYFAPALLLFTFHFTMETIRKDYLTQLLATQSTTGVGSVIYGTFTNIIDFIYALMLLVIFFFSLHLRASNKRYVYFIYLISTLLGIFMVLTVAIFIVDIIKSLTGQGNYLRKAYEVELNKIFPGYGLMVAKLLRYAILSSVGVVILPIVTYTIFFRKFGILWDYIVGSLSFIFYSPTYVNILNIYSKCRVDDVISGSNSNRNQKMKQSWKTIKMIDVGKYMIWNVILGVVLIIVQSILLVQFFTLLAILTIFTFVNFTKIILGMFYIIKYKCNAISNPLQPSAKQIQDNNFAMKRRIFDIMKRFEEDFKRQIEQSFQMAAEETQYRKFEEEMRKEERNQAKNDAKAKPDGPVQPRINPRLDSVAPMRPSRQSIKLIQAFQDNRFQNIRESSAVKKGFYPHQFGGKKEAKPAPLASDTPLEVVLLKHQIGSEAMKNADLKIGQQKLKQYEAFRGTMKPINF